MKSEISHLPPAKQRELERVVQILFEEFDDANGQATGTVSVRLPVANEFRTGLYDVDKRTVLIRLEELQRMLNMDEAERLEVAAPNPYDIEIGPNGEERVPQRTVMGVDPARVTTVMIKGRMGVEPEQLREVRLAEVRQRQKPEWRGWRVTERGHIHEFEPLGGIGRDPTPKQRGCSPIDSHVPVTVVEKRMQGRDHPVLLGVPETYYLKCLILRKLV